MAKITISVENCHKTQTVCVNRSKCKGFRRWAQKLRGHRTMRPLLDNAVTVYVLAVSQRHFFTFWMTRLWDNSVNFLGRLREKLNLSLNYFDSVDYLEYIDVMSMKTVSVNSNRRVYPIPGTDRGTLWIREIVDFTWQRLFSFFFGLSPMRLQCRRRWSRSRWAWPCRRGHLR